MPDLFGLDIAQIVADALRSAGGLQEGTLIKSVPGVDDPDDLTAPVPEAKTRHAFQGFLQDREVLRNDTLIPEAIPIMTIIGASVNPPAVPRVNDIVTLAGIDFLLHRLISRDPASAVFQFEVR